MINCVVYSHVTISADKTGFSLPMRDGNEEREASQGSLPVVLAYL